ncbi:MAG: cupin domain-containing protein [Verrucomicrobia bacterium]|nr:cupin domain-containing protein [Verrucomicrobiota bacterium]
MDKVNVSDKFKLFSAHWTPKILGEVNGSYVKIFKAKGEFVWHSHEHDDEFFLVIKGQLHIKLRDKEIILNEGEFFIVPKGVEHLPYANEEAHVLLFEPKEVINTGDAASEKTVANPEWI